MESMRAALSSLCNSVLPDDTPKVAPIPMGFDAQSPVAARQRLRGAILRLSDGSYYMVPTTEASHGPQSKKLDMSPSGGIQDVKDMSENAVSTLNIQSVLYNALFDDDEHGTSGAGLALQGIQATLKPIYNASGLTQVLVCLAGGTPQAKDIGQLSTIFPSLVWMPWDGAQGAEAPFPRILGVPLEAAAATTALGAGQLFGGGHRGAFRTATLGTIGIQPTTCTEGAAFICGFAERPILERRTIVGLAADHLAGAALGLGDSPLALIQAITATVSHALQEAIDEVPPRAFSDAAVRMQALGDVGMAPNYSQRGALLAQAVQALSALPPAPTAAAPPPLPDPANPAAGDQATINAAIAAALGPAADPIMAEAISRLSMARTSLVASGVYDQTLAGLAAALRTQGFTPSTSPISAPPAVPATPASTFAHLRPVGMELSTPSEVLAGIASAFAKTPPELAALLARAAGSPPADPFFAADAAFEAVAAAADWAVILSSPLAAAAATSIHPPASWLDAGRTLRAAMSARPPPTPRDTLGTSSRFLSADGTRPGTTGLVKGSKRATAASSLLITCLGDDAVVDAERVADHHDDPIDELKRVVATSYGRGAATLIGSDGTVLGNMPAKGERPLLFPPLQHSPPPITPPPPRLALAV
jgi:hypothetical protein